MKPYAQMKKEELIAELQRRDAQRAKGRATPLFPSGDSNAELRDAALRYRTLFGSLREAFYVSKVIYDDDGIPCDYRYVDVNPAFAELMGVDRTSIVGKTFRQLVPSFTPEWFNVFRQVASSGTPTALCFYSEYLGRYYDAYAFRPVEGEFASLFTDITERQEVEKALQESEVRYRSLIESAPEGIVVHAEGKFVLVNEAALEIFGVQRKDQLLGRSILDFIHPDSREVVIQRTRCLYEKQSKTDLCEQQVIRLGGEVIDVDTVGIPFIYDGKPAAQIVIRDITNRKQAEREIMSFNALLEQRIAERTADLEAAIREQEAFSYSVSHDLRAPLRHINSFSAILIEDHADELSFQAREYLERICASSRKMGLLIDHILELSRVTRAEMHRTAVDLSRLAAAALSMLGEIEPKRCVKHHVEPGLTALGDRHLLRQVLQNLLGNAWKYTSKKEEARIHFGKTSISGEDVFYVKDNGAGFEMAYREKLFNPFERLHGTEFEGVGIGLATAQRIIRRHGGTIWGEGIVGEGATFYFTLPSD